MTSELGNPFISGFFSHALCISCQQNYGLDVARGNETTKSYLRRFAGTCPLMAACSQKCVQEHINDLPVRQEHVNRFWTPTRYREHVKKLEVV